MTYDDLISALMGVLPENEGELAIENIRFYKSENKACFSVLSDQVIGEKGFFAVKNALQKAFPEMQVQLRIASPARAVDFVRDPDKYALPLNQLLMRECPAVRSWEFDLRWRAGSGCVWLEVPDDFCMLFLKGAGMPEKLSQAIRDIFRVDTGVEIRVAGDCEKRLREMREERERNEELLRERFRQEREEYESGKKTAPKPKPQDDRIRGRLIRDDPTPVREITDASGTVTIRGEVLSVDTREVMGGEALLVTFDVTDRTDTIKCKNIMYYRPKAEGVKKENLPPVTPAEKEKVNETVSRIKAGIGVIVRGNAEFDPYCKETVIRARDITACPLPKRTDDAPEKRIELHLHTKFSNMDAVSSPTELIKQAKEWGHEAVAITDHGVVQAFPEAFSAAKAAGIKLIPGMEGYLTDDDPVVAGEGDRPIDGPIVVLDFETTGLNVQTDRVIEIGAVKLENGHVVDSLNLFVDPGMPLPQKITEITHITDQMLKGAPKAEEAIPKLMEFAAGAPIAAHNAKFDCSVLRSELSRLGRSDPIFSLDTLTLARKLYPDLKTHRLSSVCKHLHVSLKGAHRAVNDAGATALCLREMLDACRAKGIRTLKGINAVSEGYTLGRSTHIILLAATRKGMENLNHMISEAHLKYFKRKPMIPRAVLQKYRQGVIVGSACSEGELYEAILDGRDTEELLRIARFYDYLEIQPIGNNAYLKRSGRCRDDRELRDINRRIVGLGERLGLPVCATGDVHFKDPDDSIFRTIIQNSQGFDDCDSQPPLYFRTTQEMLDEFSYLGEKKCRETVIDNPRLIASRVENVTLYPRHPENKTTFSPYWENAEKDVTDMTWGRARELYGDPLPEIVQKRIEKELKSIIGYGYATLYAIATKLVAKSLKDGYVVGSRGSVGSSLVAFMTGITEVNALPPHYRCPRCHKGFFDIPKGFTIGVDLPDKDCPECGGKLAKDGYDIPFEVFLGFKGDKVPDIDLNFSGEYQPIAHNYVKELFGEKYVYRAGTIGTVAEKTAYGYVLKYLEERGLTAREAEKNRLARGCVDVKRTTGQHPAGMVVVPKEYDICQFTAVQHPADDAGCGIITTHFDFSSMHDILVKLDILGHDDPTMLHFLEELTGVNYQDIPLDDKGVMSLFTGPEILGVTTRDIDCNTGTLGVPEFGTPFVRGMLMDTRPTTMQELIRISGLSHGTDVWLGNAKDLIDSGTAPLSQCLCTRDDIMNQLMEMGVEAKMAFDTMEYVRKGKGLKPEMESAMRDKNVPEWIIESCKKIKYMFPKGHAVAYVTMALRVAWYKVYRPLAYYAAYFTIRGDGFDACQMIVRDKDAAMARLKEFREKASAKDKTAKDESMVTAMEMVVEMMARGFRFRMADLYKSDVRKFLPVDEHTLLVPFTALGGLGESAAQGIVDARVRPFISEEDLKNRARVTTAVLDMLRNEGCLGDLPATSQVTLF